MENDIESWSRAMGLKINSGDESGEMAFGKIEYLINQ
jgi:hypothetical protein